MSKLSWTLESEHEDWETDGSIYRSKGPLPWTKDLLGPWERELRRIPPSETGSADQSGDAIADAAQVKGEGSREENSQ